MAIDATVFPSTLGSARAVEIFLQALLTRSAEYAASRNAKTMTVLHLYVFCMNVCVVLCAVVHVCTYMENEHIHAEI